MNLNRIAQKLAFLDSLEKKILFLDQRPSVISFFERGGKKAFALKKVSKERLWVILQLIFLQEWERLVGDGEMKPEALNSFLDQLFAIDQFYEKIGGLIGYHAKALFFLKKKEVQEKESVSYHAPAFIDIRKESEEVFRYVFRGIEGLSEVAEIYPLGGAADRLHLIDEKTQGDLPAAKLPFEGRTLLEGLIRDLQAREYLYYKLFGRQIEVPIVIMSSLEKQNHFHILEILKEHRWFGRSKELIRVVAQPLVPTLDETGKWCLLGPMKPFFKPGGHGAIWKLFQDEGVFTWLKSLGKKKGLIRQINNPVAGLDYGIFALMGVGWQKGRVFGFASCPRKLFAAEGVNVVKTLSKKKVVLTNIEYCDFKKFGIEEIALAENESYSRFSSNTNLLFFDLEAVCQAVKKSPYPGLLVNCKEGVFLNEKGEKKKQRFIRLESTMQNIADVFLENKKEGFETLKTFATYNVRHKTISTAKRAFVEGGNFEETPEKCFYEKLQAHRELLEKRCQIALPPVETFEEMLAKGPAFLFLYHPALGPLYADIEKKIRRGVLSHGASLELEIADVLLENLFLDGALSIRAESILGKQQKERLIYSHEVGRASIKDVQIKNRGVDWNASRPFWKNQKRYEEQVSVLLKGNGEWIAEGFFEGSHHFVVEEGERMRVIGEGKKVWIEKEKKAGKRDLSRLPFFLKKGCN